jgi:sugar-specific transcriptional regulator TrmB
MQPKILTSLGIREKEAQIYLAGLSLGTTTIQELARASGLKRPTVYLHMDELVKRNLFDTVAIGNKTYYRAADPALIEAQLQKSLELFKTEVPKLLSLQTATLGKPQVRVLEGESGARQIYEELKNVNSFRVWSNLGQIYSPFHDVYMELCEAIAKNGIGVREIIADTKESRRYARLMSKIAGSTYAVKVATEEGIENDAIVYGNVVALFSLSGLNRFVVRIEDKATADSMRAIFEMAWKTAKVFK